MRGSGPQHTQLRQTAASVRQSGLSESDGSDLSADYSFLSAYLILLILHLKFSLACRMFFLTDVWQPWNDLQCPCQLCYIKAAVICQIRQFKSLNVCFCDLLPFFLCFLGSVLVMRIRLFFSVPPYCSLSIRGHCRALGTVSIATATADKESVLRQGCERTSTLVSCGALACLLALPSFGKWAAIFVELSY